VLDNSRKGPVMRRAVSKLKTAAITITPAVKTSSIICRAS